MTTKLSLSKFCDLLLKYGYTVSSVYAIDGRVLFVESKTPKIQKTFIIYIPQKYHIKCDTDIHKIIKIHEITRPPRFDTDYFENIKGGILQCDILSVSNILGLIRNNGDTLFYGFGEVKTIASKVEDKADVDDTEEEIADKLMKNTKKIMDKIDPKRSGSQRSLDDVEEADEARDEGNFDAEAEGNLEADIEVDIEDKEPEIKKDAKDNADDDDVESQEKIVELEFEEENNDNGDDHDDDNGDDQDDEDNDDQLEKPDFLDRKLDNSIPDKIENEDIDIGIIYFCIDLSSLYKKLTLQSGDTSAPADKKSGSTTSSSTSSPTPKISFENEVLYAYNTMDDIEAENRAIKYDEISELCSKISEKTKGIINKHNTEELALKTQLLKLSVVLENAEKLRLKSNSEAKKFAHVKPEIDRLYNQTKMALSDINIEIIKNKDRTNDSLNNISSVLDELLKL